MRAVVAASLAVALGAATVYILMASTGDGDAPSSTRSQRHSTDGLGLTSNWPAAYRAACERLAAHARHRRYGTCPTLLPEGPIEVEIASEWSKQRTYTGGFTMSMASCSLNAYKGRRIETNGCHWAYDVGWSEAVKPLVRRGALGGSGNPANPTAECVVERLEGATVRRCLVPAFEEGGGFHAGHVAYLWDRGVSVHTLSAHGYENQPRVRAMMASLIHRLRCSTSPRSPR